MLLILAACRQSPAEQPGPTEAIPGPQIRTSYSGAAPPGAVERLGKGTLGVITFSPDGSQIAAGGDAGLFLYSAANLEDIWALPITAPVISLAFSPDNRLLAAGGRDGSLSLIDVSTGEILEATPAHETEENGVYSLAWGKKNGSDEEFSLATGFNDGNVTISQIAVPATTPIGDGLEINLVGFLDRLPGGATALAFNPKGNVLAIGDRSGQVSLWDAQNLQWFGSMLGHGKDQAVRGLAWSPKGDKLLSSGRDGALIEWDVLTFEPLREFSRPAETFGITYLSDGDILTTEDDSGFATFWTPNSNEADGQSTRVGTELRDAAWSPRGDRLGVVDSNGELSLWPFQDGSLAATPDLILTGYSQLGQATAATAWSPDGRKVASGLGDEVIIWDVASGEPDRILDGHTSQINDLAWSPDGDRLASASRDQTTIIWDPVTGDQIRTLGDHNHSVSDLAWSPDGNLLVSAGSLDDTAVIWDSETGEVRYTFSGDGKGIWSVAWSPDGGTLATGTTEGTILFWDLAADPDAGPTKAIRRHLDWVAGLDYSPDGSLLASAGADNRLVLTRLADDQAQTYVGHRGPVRRVHFSPDGTKLASAGRGGLVIVWPADFEGTTDPLIVYEGHTDAANDASWSPAGDRLASASDDGTVIIWEVVSDQ